MEERDLGPDLSGVDIGTLDGMQKYLAGISRTARKSQAEDLLARAVAGWAEAEARERAKVGRWQAVWMTTLWIGAWALVNSCGG